jgi:hypothetical protein
MHVVALFFTLVAASATSGTGSPIDRVVELINGFREKIVADGAAEQKVYDKYACWCEETTARKAAAIEDAKLLIEELSKNILELKGRLGTYQAEIAKLTKDVKGTTEEIEKAEEMRKKENEDYIKKKGDLEHALVNLGKAIDTLTKGTTFEKSQGQKDIDASMVKAGVKTEEEVALMGVAAGLRSALSAYNSVSLKTADTKGLKSFLSNPNGALVQEHANPAGGTYNAQSGAIQGILSQMKDDMEKDLETSAEEEAAAAEAHAKLMETKRSDLALLEATLVKTKKNQGEDTMQLAEDQEERSETQLQLKADEKFFDETKKNCQAKAEMWSGRSRSRTEELAAIDEAIGILTSPEAQATFANSSSTLIQHHSTSTVFLQTEAVENGPKRVAAFNLLKKVAQQSHSLRLASIASTVQTMGHFDKVIKDIDLMIKNLRDEEKADIEHRDWCETNQKAAESKNENLQYDMEQLTQKIERATGEKEKLEEEVTKTQDEKNQTLEAMAEALANRNEENAKFKQALKDDAAAVGLIAQAVEVLSGYYSLIQKKQPEYKENPDTPPEIMEGEYGGRKSEGGGIIAILSMIKEDIEKEMKVASEEEADALKAYQELNADSQATVDALDAKIVSLGQDIAAKMKAIAEFESVKQNKADSESATDTFLEDLGPNCDWVDKFFDSRMEKRKAEMDGLQEAKAILAGAGAEGPTLVTVHQTVDQELQDLDDTEKKFQRSFLQARKA